MINLNKFLLGLSFFLLFIACAFPSFAQEVREQMNLVRESFSKLQPYLADSYSFQNSDNEDEIFNLVKDIKDNFHTIDSLKGDLAKEPAFRANLKVAQDTIRDASNRFLDGDKAYALWRLRSVASNCISCHAQFNSELNFSSDEQALKLNDFERAEFYFAIRQYDKADAAFLKTLKNPAFKDKYLVALRRWLVIQIRSAKNKEETINKLKELLKSNDLSMLDKQDVERWISSLVRVKTSNNNTTNTLIEAESLIKKAITNSDAFSSETDEVSLLLAVKILNSQLALPRASKTPALNRSRVLYLLGFSYSHLQLFFIDELPEIYLVQCIEEFPGSEYAKKSYNLYRKKLELDFTGSRGIDIPSDISLRLKELHDKAFGLSPTLHIAGG